MADADFIKDPDAVLDYIFDWSQWLPGGDTIISAQFFPAPGITLNSSTFTGTNATAWLAGGSSGRPYTLTCRITTAQGRTDDRTMTIRVQQR